ncbi:MAG: hypothetical protein DIZ80_01385 [endosymbiont of Galathealinum brachiosum]|uniref:Long-chain fatty acid transporter n=1 Tax=endosymbiont of Galathealinum brachiosum TaxID=2200906 RepID=A0A370DML4_9GAMM|nr:MAG: hypothetical protein DIZ80_01385 [endosymbiont of Galathealinum brachiosum]
MKTYLKRALCIATTVGLMAPTIATATNGYFLIGFGAKSRAMGGTGVAYNMEGMAAAFNPATMVDSENEFDLGAEIFHPPRSIYHDSGVLGFTDEPSNHDLFMIPSMGGTYKYDDNITLGFAFIGAGLKTEYNQSDTSSSCQRTNSVTPGSCPPTVFNPALTTVPGGEAGVELVQMQILPSIAYKLNNQHSVGASLAIGWQFFRAEGLESFGDLGFTPNSTAIDSGWDNSYGAGIRLGYFGKFLNDDLSVGVNYSSRTYMTKFEDYNNLFAEQGDFDIPENYTIGLAYKVIPDLVVALDIQRINYSDVKSVGNPGPNAADPGDFNPLCPGLDDDSCKLGGDNGMGFGWVDQTIYKLGVDWSYSEKINLRAGLNYGESPIQSEEVLFNMLAPATPESHITIGASYMFNKDYELAVNYMHAFENVITGPTAFGPGGSVVEGTNAAISMVQNSLGATLRIKF